MVQRCFFLVECWVSPELLIWVVAPLLRDISDKASPSARVLGSRASPSARVSSKPPPFLCLGFPEHHWEVSPGEADCSVHCTGPPRSEEGGHQRGTPASGGRCGARPWFRHGRRMLRAESPAPALRQPAASVSGLGHPWVSPSTSGLVSRSC